MKWQKVYSATDMVKAEVVRATLEERGVKAVVINKTDSSYNAFGEKEVYVEEINKEKALLILKQDVEFK